MTTYRAPLDAGEAGDIYTRLENWEFEGFEDPDLYPGESSKKMEKKEEEKAGKVKKALKGLKGEGKGKGKTGWRRRPSCTLKFTAGVKGVLLQHIMFVIFACILL